MRSLTSEMQVLADTGCYADLTLPRRRLFTRHKTSKIQCSIRMHVSTQRTSSTADAGGILSE